MPETAVDPRITIITVCWNAEKTVEHTLQSVRDQKYPNIEYVVIDGKSYDGTMAILEANRDLIDVLVSEKDTGIYNAMNKGIDRSTGEWLLFLGADDVLESGASDLFFQLKNYSGYACVYGDVGYDDGKVMRTRVDWMTLLTNRLHHQGTAYAKALFTNFRYDESLRFLSDYELNLKIYKQRMRSKKFDVLMATCGAEGVTITNREIARKEAAIVRRRHTRCAWLWEWTAAALYFVLDRVRKLPMKKGSAPAP